jgi:hypothetical protein
VPSSSGFPALAVCKDLSRAELYPSSNANCLQGLLAARFDEGRGDLHAVRSHSNG